MTETEQLLRAYLLAKNLTIHANFKIEMIETAGEWVTFHERSEDGYYSEAHKIPLLDIVAWVYGEGLRNLGRGGQ